ncbi:histidine kinase [Undibacterium sp. RTI2.1]|uniref:sensor histidine kinase n=1 Tax=unclassified Undibacterium TaxID=2630295 RepID=UPI002AB416CB|nr:MULTISPECIES: histidine kinase [unclassified Undibacterium]MDY7539793.1 histidine kinase [Undibacterium sp. 5I1]MEB0029420.1 histidine kinase [Undibacterium sp. RTI2.1]MEB0115961.1 histidine kinase [Undibacterium sp. RTI2.2]MEB0232049.1 histidine kinase [Undibacterium sp. 10I3]MEB0256829.1 histidine kinase [Undibacterium sp. 5I1]
MYSTRSKITIATAWLLFSLLMVWVAVQDFQRDGGRLIWQPILWESSSAITGLFILLIQRRLTKPYDYLLATPWRWFALQMMCLPIQWICFVSITFGIRHGVYALMGMHYYHRDWPELFLYESSKLSIFLSMFMVILFGLLSYFELVKQKLHAEQSNALLRQAQLQRMTQQMQPHFLFNALNTISSLMHTDVDKADATLIQLADVLRATLEVSEQHEAPLSTELRLVRGYASVMAERYADRVTLDWQIDPDTLTCTMPVMSLQPLLENIFKHTVEQCRQTTHIQISAKREKRQSGEADGNGKSDILLLRLSDDQGKLQIKNADAGSHSGIGLRNIRERLALQYRDDTASLTLTQLSPAGVLAEMRLPWRTACAS